MVIKQEELGGLFVLMDLIAARLVCFDTIFLVSIANVGTVSNNVIKPTLLFMQPSNNHTC